MKHSRILLGATTFVLGIAGAISTMGSNKFVANSKVFTTKGTCVLWTTACTTGNIKCTTGTAAHRTVYTSTTNCLHTHFKQ
jgi:hypothetical protein